MDAYIEDKPVLFTQLHSHLTTLQQNPSTPLDADLLKRAERSLDSHTPQPQLWTLLQTGEALLPTLTTDPLPLTRLLERTISLLPFSDLQSATTTKSLTDGLLSSSIPIQLLCLAYLHRAGSTPSGASFIASSPDLVSTLITTLLATPNTEIFDRALNALVDLLTVDSPSTTTLITTATASLDLSSTTNESSPETTTTTTATTAASNHAQGHALLHRRIFTSPQIYTLFFAYTTPLPHLSRHHLSTKKGQQDMSISQARLFDFLARMAVVDWGVISTTALPDVEREFVRRQGEGYGDGQQQQPQPYGGLLKYAASEMVDQEDLIMLVLRREFFGKLVGLLREGAIGGAGAGASENAVSPRAVRAIEMEAGVQEEAQGQGEGMYL